MFHGGGPPGGRYPRQYAPRCRIQTPFEQPQGPRMATGFGPRFGPVSYNMPSRPTVPCGSFVPHQYERNQHHQPSTFPQFYHSSYSTGKSEPSPGNNQGPCGGPPGENIGRQPNPSLPFAGFSIDPTQVSVGSSPLGLPAHTQSSQFNPLSQEHVENERAGEEFLRCLAAKEKYPVRDGVVNRQDSHYRHPCPGNGQRQEPKDDHVCKRPTLGRSKSRPRSRSRSRGKSMGRSKSRPRSRSREKILGRSKSRPRSRSRSRGKSMGRSKSRPRSRSREKILGRSKSRPRSRSRSRGKSMGRSKSRPRSRSRSRGKSMGRSKSRPRSRSRSLGKSVGMSCTQAAGRGPSRSCSGTSTSSNSSSNNNNAIECTSRRGPPSKKTALDMFRELLLSGKLKEREELLNLAALKKELGIAGHGRPSTQTSHPSVNIFGEHHSRGLPSETQSSLSAVTKGMEPGLFASIPGQMRQQSHGQRVQAVREDLNTGQYAETSGSAKQETEEESVGEFLLPHERVRHDSSGFSRILGMLGNQPDMQERKKLFTDIEDEEEFLYGDVVDTGEVSVRTEAEERQAVVDFEKIKKALTTIGLDLGMSEISKLMARTQEHQTTESPHHKEASSSGGLSPSQSHRLKRNRSPNPEIYSNSHSSAKQALYIGASAGLVKTEFDATTQEKQAREIPFFRPDNVQQTSLGSETEIWGHSQLKVANYCSQKPNLPVRHAPAVDHQILGLGPLKEILETVKAKTKAPGMDTLFDLANQSAHMRTSQRKKNSEDNAKVNEEALKTDVQEQMKRKDHLLKELESLLKREVSPFVVPVIGFCCQLCEEFFGDITSAQDHATCQSHKEKCKVHPGEKHGSWNKKLGGNLEARPTVDTGKRGLRESEHKWTSRDDSKGYRGIGGQVSEKLEATRQARVVSGPNSAIPSKKTERKEMDSPRSSVTDRGEDASSKAHKKKKKKKEKKKLKKEKKEKKREREKNDRM